MKKSTLQELLSVYFDIKDELEDYTSEHHDDILWDVQGYHEEIAENPDDEEYYDELHKDLEKQVTLFKEILKAYENGTDAKVLEAKIEYVFC